MNDSNKSQANKGATDGDIPTTSNNSAKKAASQDNLAESTNQTKGAMNTNAAENTKSQGSNDDPLSGTRVTLREFLTNITIMVLIFGGVILGASHLFNYLEERVREGELVTLIDANVDDSTAMYFRELRGLKILRLDDTKISDLGTRFFPPNLEVLWLCDTAVTDECVAQLIKLKKLRELKLYGTKVTAIGREKLQKAFGSALTVWMRVGI